MYTNLFLENWKDFKQTKLWPFWRQMCEMNVRIPLSVHKLLENWNGKQNFVPLNCLRFYIIYAFNQKEKTKWKQKCSVYSMFNVQCSMPNAFARIGWRCFSMLILFVFSFFFIFCKFPFLYAIFGLIIARSALFWPVIYSLRANFYANKFKWLDRIIDHTWLNIV